MSIPVLSLWKSFINTVIKVLVVRKNDMTSDIVELETVSFDSE